MSQTQANEDEANRDCSTSDNMSDETHDLINKILDKVTKLRQGLKQDFEKEVDLVNDEMEQLEQQMKGFLGVSPLVVSDFCNFRNKEE